MKTKNVNKWIDPDSLDAKIDRGKRARRNRKFEREVRPDRNGIRRY